MERDSKYNLGKFYFSFLVLQFLLDFIYKIYQNSEYQFFISSISKGIKFLFLLCSLYFLLLRKRNDIFIGFLLLFICFLLGQLFLSDISSPKDFLELLKEYILYCSPLVFVALMGEIKSDFWIGKFLTWTSILILIVSLSVFLGFFFEIKLFKTYYSRFGYSGLLHKSVTASYFFITSLLFCYYRFCVENKNKKLFFVVLFTSFLVGTKSLYFFYLLLFLYHFYSRKWYNNAVFWSCSSILLMTVMIFKRQFLPFLKDTFAYWYDFSQNSGIVTALFSFRNIILQEKGMHYFEHWNFLNYLFGGKIFSMGLFESSVIDLLSFFGLIGGFIYIYIIYRINLNKFFKKTNYLMFSIFTVFFISIFAGQLFNNFSSVTYMLWLYYLLNNIISEEHESKDGE